MGSGREQGLCHMSLWSAVERGADLTLSEVAGLEQGTAVIQEQELEANKGDVRRPRRGLLQIQHLLQVNQQNWDLRQECAWYTGCQGAGSGAATCHLSSH